MAVARKLAAWRSAMSSTSCWRATPRVWQAASGPAAVGSATAEPSRRRQAVRRPSWARSTILLRPRPSSTTPRCLEVAEDPIDRRTGRCGEHGQLVLAEADPAVPVVGDPEVGQPGELTLDPLAGRHEEQLDHLGSQRHVPLGEDGEQEPVERRARRRLPGGARARRGGAGGSVPGAARRRWPSGRGRARAGPARRRPSRAGTR